MFIFVLCCFFLVSVVYHSGVDRMGTGDEGLEELVSALPDKLHEDAYIDFSDEELKKARSNFECTSMI